MSIFAYDVFQIQNCPTFDQLRVTLDKWLWRHQILDLKHCSILYTRWYMFIQYNSITLYSTVDPFWSRITFISGYVCHQSISPSGGSFNETKDQMSHTIYLLYKIKVLRSYSIQDSGFFLFILAIISCFATFHQQKLRRESFSLGSPLKMILTDFVFLPRNPYLRRRHKSRRHGRPMPPKVF